MKILSIQHAGGLGGSAKSLLLTLEGLRRRGHACVVALARPNPEVSNLYERAGFEVRPWPLRCWDHSTVAPRPLGNPLNWWELVRVFAGWRETGRKTLELVNAVRPDVVHLNSMPLSASAEALIEARVPFVWHVREPPPDQSWRTRRIRSIMLRAPSLIFLSHFDQWQWLNTKKGKVIRNFVEKKAIQEPLGSAAARNKLGIPENGPVFTYLGGLSPVKGIFVLLDALGILKRQGFRFKCILPATTRIPPRTFKGRVARVVLPWFGWGVTQQLFEKRLRKLRLGDAVVRLPFQNSVDEVILASDFLVFPAVRPHFARPVIEAAALGRPSVVSKLGGLDELIIDGKTGVAVEPGSAVDLARGIESFMNDRELTRKFGLEAMKFAEQEFDFDKQVKEVEKEILATK